MKSKTYNVFWQHIHNAAKLKAFPLRVMFELTYRCNFNCKHCYVPLSYRRYRELKTNEVFFILDQLALAGCFYLGFTGGEPFLRKDIMDILWYAKRCGFEIIIYTNGSLINAKLAKELKKLKPNKVDITISSMKKGTFERISQVNGSRNKVFRAIELLHKNRVNLGFKTCILKENENEIKDIQKFSKSLGASHRLDSLLSSGLDGSNEPYRYRGRLFNTDYRECIDNKVNSDSPVISKNSRLFKCGVGISQTAITPSGELKMCVMIDYPKYKILNNNGASKEDCLQDTWKRLKELVTTIKINGKYHCDKCELSSYCKWCPGKSWLYNKTFISCVPQCKYFAQNEALGLEDYGRENLSGFDQKIKS